MTRDKRALAEELFESIMGIMRRLGTEARLELEANRLTWSQFHMLKAVEQDGNPTVTDISRFLLVSPPTASRMIESLCRKGLLEKRRDPGDMRMTRVGLTNEGRCLVERLSESRNRTIIELLDFEETGPLETAVNVMSRLAVRSGEITDGGKGVREQA